MHSRFTRWAAGVVVALSLFGVVGVAQAQESSGLTSTQIAAIVSLLQSFGASSSIVANVQATLSGEATVGTAPSCLSLSYNLYAGMTDSQSNGEVSQLQSFLGITPTGYFGPMTQQGIQNWQSSHGIVSSGSPDTTGYGFVGPETRQAMGCGGQTTEPIQPTTSTWSLGVSAVLPSSTGTMAPYNVSVYASYPVVSCAETSSNTGTYTVSFGDGSSEQLTFGGIVCPNDEGGSPIAGWRGASHVYTSPGSYIAQLTDSSGNVLATQTITVTGSNSASGTPTLTINQSSLTTTSGTPTITGTASNVSSVYVMLSGNGQGAASEGVTPVLNGIWSTPLYVKGSTTLPPGTYTVSVYNGLNGPLLTTGTLTVQTNPSQNFTATPTTGVAPLTVTFTGTEPGTNYTINFGDGSNPIGGSMSCDPLVMGNTSSGCSSIPVNQTHTYTLLGTYTAVLSGSQSGQSVLITVTAPTTTVAPTGSLTAVGCTVTSTSSNATCGVVTSWTTQNALSDYGGPYTQVAVFSNATGQPEPYLPPWTNGVNYEHVAQSSGSYTFNLPVGTYTLYLETSNGTNTPVLASQQVMVNSTAATE